MGTGHSHGHVDAEGVSWVQALRQPGFRALGILLIAAAVLTSAALIVLWPSGDNEAIEGALRRFKRKCEKAGILSEIKKRQHFEKPSVMKKKKQMQARKKLLKKLAQEKRMMGDY